MRLTNNVREAIDQLGQALTDADSHNGGLLDDQRDRIQYAMRLLMDREDKDLALKKYTKVKLDEYVSDVKKIHQNFENKFRFKNYDKIKF